MKSSGLFVIALSLVVGCSVEAPPEPTVGCDSTRQCEIYRVCHVLRRECLPEQEQHVTGSFYCSNVFGTTVGSGSGVGSFSEVVGRVNLFDPRGGRSMFRVNAIAPPLCQLDGGVLYVLFFEPNVNIEGVGGHVRFNADVAKLQPGVFVDTTETDTYRAFAARGEVVTPKTNYQQSGDTRLQIYVDRTPVIGAPLRGFIEVDFEDIVPP